MVAASKKIWSYFKNEIWIYKVCQKTCCLYNKVAEITDDLYELIQTDICLLKQCGSVGKEKTGINLIGIHDARELQIYSNDKYII